MKTDAPRIGFDRFIQLDWATAALKARAGMAGLNELNTLLDAAGLGVAARTKTRTVLNRLWLEPRAELIGFADRGAGLCKANPAAPAVALSWGMAIATYPFFGKVAELIGRLAALQGDCAAAEVQRRMSEHYGEREGTYRMTNRVIQTQAGWGAVERIAQGRRLIRRPPRIIADAELVAWLIEAAVRYTGKGIAVSALPSLAVLYPFALDGPLAFIVSNSAYLELRSEGSGSQWVALRQSA